MSAKRSPIDRLDDMVFVVFVFASLTTLVMAVFVDRLEQRVEALEAKEGK